MFNNNIFKSSKVPSKEVITIRLISLILLCIVSIIGMAFRYNMTFDWQVGKSFHINFYSEVDNRYHDEDGGSSNNKTIIDNDNKKTLLNC